MIIPPDLDDARDPMVAVPRPWGHYALMAPFLGSFLAFGAIQEHELATNDPAKIWLKGESIEAIGSDRWFAFGLCGFFYFGMPIFAVMAMVWTPFLAIGKQGLKAGAGDLAWDQIIGCHWNHHRPGALEVRGHGARYTYSLPNRYRAEVESALRKLGKWEN